MKLLIEIEGCFNDNHIVFSEISRQLERVYFAPTKTFILLNIYDEKDYKNAIRHIITSINHDNKLSLVSVHPVYEKYAKTTKKSKNSPDVALSLV